MRYLFALIAICIGVGWAIARSEPPAASATTFSTPGTMEVTVPNGSDEPVIRWRALEGIEHYRLTARYLAVRVHAAAPYCTPPLAEDRRTVEVDEQLDGGVTEFALQLPELPVEDAWYLASGFVQIEAFDADGAVIAAGGGGGVTETPFCTATATPGPILPDTGSGPNSPERTWPAAAAIAAAIAIMGVVLVAYSARRRD